MAPLTLRARLLIGAFLWTIGLFGIAGVIVTHLVYHYPNAPRTFHAPFTHTPLAVSLATLCMAVGLLQVRRGLSAVAQVRERLADVHAGRESRLQGKYPGEMQPLVSDLNALLAARDASVARAQAKAADLAHGLKTPLAILTQEADRAGAAGLADVAAAIRLEIARMQRQIDYHLAHARASASGATAGARAQVAAAIEGLVRAMNRLHADRGLRIDCDVNPAHAVRAHDQDLEEMLGNLLDNACKWARTRVAVRAAAGAGEIIITIDDDGAGLEPAMRDAVLQRGVRADEAAPGSGLGLAIVRDLAEVYGGSVVLGQSPLGGLRATLRLKDAD
ncbi:MAG TPA: sensor histidine kinase [Vicinamibacterales bacterium]|nr:sensor histidine kinase [Vicinamibacterales bacterium]